MKKLLLLALASSLTFLSCTNNDDVFLEKSPQTTKTEKINKIAGREAESKLDVSFNGQPLTEAQGEDAEFAISFLLNQATSETDRRTAHIDCQVQLNPGYQAYLVTVSGDGQPPRQFIGIYHNGEVTLYLNDGLDCRSMYQIAIGTIN
ncbi:hypothetical protein [Chryseobacterium sp. EO14]|uniref:hypothetical protein n=1 Tax=Chryseobacterium sp. EO14 TaxID=2950551 RepID=UPI002108A8AD|nr:hypothetical protein [Chryseobacterium sp. EO14]MCQ4139191.1 hypothetical protein [Chryseobacterium sp. EO14]